MCAKFWKYQIMGRRKDLDKGSERERESERKKDRNRKNYMHVSERDCARREGEVFGDGVDRTKSRRIKSQINLAAFFLERKRSRRNIHKLARKTAADINGRVSCNGIDCGVCSICSDVYVIRSHNTFHKSIHIHIY